MELNTIGRNMKKVRLEKKLRQEDVAEKAEISLTYYGAVERGEKIPSLDALIEILNALEISADMVMCDVVHNGYEVKNSLLNDKLQRLSPEDQVRIYDVIDVLMRHSTIVNP